MENKNEDQFILMKEEIENNKAEMKDVFCILSLSLVSVTVTR